MVVVIATLIMVLGLPAFAAKAPVAQTGQIECFDPNPQVNNPVIPCTRTGQDGEFQAGVTPPTPRFKDQGNGTVEDRLTGLIWLKQDDCLGPVSWAQALEAASTLVSGRCGLMDGSKA